MFAALTFAVIYVVRKKPEEQAQALPTATATQQEQVPVFAPPPPPPPPPEEPDAGADGGTSRVTSSGGGSGKGPCTGKCEGTASAALQSALRGAAGSAKSCYDRALQRSEVSGSLTVAVQVGANGSVCGANITNDTVGSGEVSNCVLGRFRGRSFPAPDGGCVTVNIPINFTIKQP